MEQCNKVTIEQWINGYREQWSNGTMENGTMEL